MGDELLQVAKNYMLPKEKWQQRLEQDYLAPLIHVITEGALDLRTPPLGLPNAVYRKPTNESERMSQILDIAATQPVAHMAIGPWSHNQYFDLEKEFSKVLDRLPYLKNVQAQIEKLPEDIWYHGASGGFPDDKLQAIGLPSGGQLSKDMNTGLGIHMGAHPSVSVSFGRGSPDPRIITAKVKSGNPLIAADEDVLDKMVIEHGLQSGKRSDIANTTGLPVASINHAVDSGNPLAISNVVGRLNAELKDKLTTNYLGKIIQEGYDSIIYGNHGEGWRNNPSLIVPFAKQIEPTGRIVGPQYPMNVLAEPMRKLQAKDWLTALTETLKGK